jgi:hypothetical protein
LKTIEANINAVIYSFATNLLCARKIMLLLGRSKYDLIHEAEA